jgi:mannose-6-phosphate isomerase-like protein (cupin superfamily)
MQAATKTLHRFDATQGPRVVPPDGGRAHDLGGLGVRFMTWTEETGGGFSLVEHPIKPHHLCAPLHRHSREDEYSYVIEGRMGALLGDDVVYAGRGDLVFKPRDQWHTFWNAGDEPCRILEIISPGGFEHYFDELAEMQARPGFGPEMVGPLGARYGLDFDPGSIPRLCEQYGLTFPSAGA